MTRIFTEAKLEESLRNCITRGNADRFNSLHWAKTTGWSVHEVVEKFEKQLAEYSSRVPPNNDHVAAGK